MKTSRWIRPFSFTLLIVVLPLVSYYLYFVGSQETFLLDRFHAHLANMAATTDARIESAISVISRNPNSPNVLGLGPLGPVPKLDGGSAGECGDPSVDADVRVSRGERHQIRFDRTPIVPETAQEYLCSAAADTNILIGDIDPNGEFRDVVILDEQDRVVYQLAAVDGRIGDGELVVQLADDDDSTPAVSDPLSRMRTSYHGRDFLLFREPLSVPFAIPAEATSESVDTAPSWKIVGLLPESEFNRLKYTIRPGGIVLVAAIIAAMLIAAPFLKLWYLGRFEPLTRFDICLQIGAGLCLVAMVTVSLYAYDMHERLTEHYDSILDAQTARLKSTIETEFGTAVGVLDRLESPMVSAYAARLAIDPGFKTDKDCWALARREDSHLDLPGADGPTLAGDLLKSEVASTRSEHELAHEYGQLVMAYLMDQRGCQIVKWSSEAKPAEPGQYRDRPYFLRSLPDERVPLGLWSEDPEYFQQVIVSRTSGERRVAFSKPIGEPGCGSSEVDRSGDERDCQTPRRRCTAAIRDPDSAPVPCVSVITTELRSLEAVLPVGYGAILVDAASNIVLTSDGDNSSEINLADEVGDPARLRDIVRIAIESHTGNDQPFDTDYRRVSHRFRVTPLDGGEWALVTFYNRNLAMNAVLDTVGVSIVTWVIWASIIVTLLVAAWMVDDVTERGLRRWPANAVIAGVLAVVWFFVAVRAPEVRWLSLTAIGIPASLWPLRLLTREDRYSISPGKLRALAVCSTWIAVFLAAAYPMSDFFRSTRYEVASALERFQSDELELAKRRQQDTFDIWKHKVGLGADESWMSFSMWESPTNDGAGADDRAGNGDSAADGDPVGNVPAYECRYNYVCEMLRRLPDLAGGIPGARGMYQVARSRTSDEPGSADEDGGGEDLLGNAPEGHRLRVWLSVFAFFLVLMPGTIWYLLVRTFGLRAENVVRISTFTIPKPGERARYMLYGVPASERRTRYFDSLEEPHRVWIDLRDTVAETEIEISDSAEVVALDYFDVNLSDIGVARQRVELLERLLREERRIVLLFVSTDPLNFASSVYSLEVHGALLARFATALSRFKLTYHRTKASGSRRAKTTLADLVRRCITKPSLREDWRRALVRAECRHPDLWPIRDELLDEREEKALRGWSKGQIIQQVQSRANAIYQHMWNQCTRIEKFTLMELAHGNPINPNNWDAARRLRLRGYVVTDPFYRIASESLRQFVSRASVNEDVQSWRAESPGAWGQIKIPLIVLLVGALVFAGFTRPDLFNAFFAVMAAGAASFPFLISALSARLQRSARSGS